ncbi:26S proteasome non-ATPase regulatory subunit 10-like, partial [Halyomorpha halys]|uniref:26S proteasome non-ATPase regulatory subunit 10-like n=1 Tax=Halyomorpha halys TaxID=286706 RepID=UPI0034D27369
MMNIPAPILKEILLIVDKAASLEAAIEVGNIEVVKWLLQFDIHLEHLETLLNSAFSKNRIDIVKVLIEKGALDNLSQHRKVKHLISSKQETLLHLAAQSQRPAAVTALLEAGSGPNAEDIDGYTPLHRAVEAGDVESVVLLVRGGANVNQATPSGDLPLHIAVSKANLRMTKLLIKLGSSLDSKNDLGFTPFSAAENTVVAAVVRYIEDIKWEHIMNISKGCREKPNVDEKCDSGNPRSVLSSILLEEMNEFFTNLNMKEIFCQDNNIPFVIS